MHALQTAILQHTTARVSPPPTHWHALGRFDLEVLPPHRRAYLTYQGPVSNNRGWVRRAAQGRCFVELWTPARILLRPDLPIGCARIELRQHAGQRWLAVAPGE